MSKSLPIVKIAVLALVCAGMVLAPVAHGVDLDCRDPNAYYTNDDGTVNWNRFTEYLSECNRTEDVSVWDLLGNGINGILAIIFNWIATGFSWVIGWESVLIGDLLGPRFFQFASSPLVHTGWYVSLQIANLALVLGLLFLADKIILGLESFGDYKKLLKYVVTAIFINFSLVIGGTIVGMSNAVTYYFLGLSGSSADITNRLLQLTNIYGEMMTDQNNILVGAVVGFIGVNILALFTLIFGAILFTTFKRIITLWVALIFLPLAYILGNLDLGIGASAWGSWKKEFGKAITFPPIMAFFLWFTFMIMDRSSELFVAGHLDDQFWLARLMQAAIFTAFLVLGYQQAVGISGASMGALDKAIGSTAKLWGIDKWAGKKGEAAWKGLQTGIKGGLADARSEILSKFNKANLQKHAASNNPLESWYGRTVLGAQRSAAESAYKAKIEPLEKDFGSLERDQLLRVFKESPDPKKRAAAYKVLTEKHAAWFSRQMASEDALLKGFKPVADAYGIKLKADEIAYQGTYRHTTGTGPADETKRAKALLTYIERDKGGYRSSTDFANLQRDIAEMTNLAKTAEPEVAERAKKAVAALKKMNPLMAGAEAADVVEDMNGEELGQLETQVLHDVIDQGYLTSEKQVLNLMRALRAKSRAALAKVGTATDDAAKAIAQEQANAIAQQVEGVGQQIMEKGPQKLREKLQSDPTCAAYYRAANTGRTESGESRTESGLFVETQAPRRPEPPGGQLG